MHDSLGDRMKSNYEDRYRFKLPRRIPCIIRVDGKAFHTFTKKFEKPFSADLQDAMQYAALNTMQEMQSCKAAFTQSDECSFLLTDYDDLQTQAWFDYNKSKIESVTSSLYTAYFAKRLYDPRVAIFDARAFSIPREEVSNYFLWRMKDWKRNSLNMYCQSFFSHKELHGKNMREQDEMLHSIGKNWATDLEDKWKNGSLLLRQNEGIVVRHDVPPVFTKVNDVLHNLINIDATSTPTAK